MKFIVATVLMMLLAFVSGLYFPWWVFSIPVLIVAALVHQRPWKAFFSGFLALLLLWGGMALFIDINNNGILSTRVAGVFAEGLSSVVISVATAVIGALIGGFAALTGSYLRK